MAKATNDDILKL